MYRPTYQKLLPYFTDYQHEQICYILKHSSTPGSAHLQLLELFQSMLIESLGFDNPMALARLVYEYKEKFLRTKLIRDLKAQGFATPPRPKPSSVATKEEKQAKMLKGAIIYKWPTEEEQIAARKALFSKEPKEEYPFKPCRPKNPEELKTEVRRVYLNVKQENPTYSDSEVIQLTRQRVHNMQFFPGCTLQDIVNIIVEE